MDEAFVISKVSKTVTATVHCQLNLMSRTLSRYCRCFTTENYSHPTSSVLDTRIITIILFENQFRSICNRCTQHADKVLPVTVILIVNSSAISAPASKSRCRDKIFRGIGICIWRSHPPTLTSILHRYIK